MPIRAASSAGGGGSPLPFGSSGDGSPFGSSGGGSSPFPHAAANSGFIDPARGREVARGMYDGGADVVYHAAGGSGGGLFAAAREVSEATGSKVWAIGVDSDQYLTADEELREHILTSMLKRVDVAVYETIRDFVETGEFTGGYRAFGLADDGVGYSTSGGFVDDITDQLEELRQQIIDGEITVPEAP